MTIRQYNNSRRRRGGFTLIELLIVIAIIGILAAVVIAVINPAAQRWKAKEGVTKANLAKVCQALTACMSSLSTPNTASCNEWSEIGVLQPTQPPPGDLYYNYSLRTYGDKGDSHYVQVYVMLNNTGRCGYLCRVRNDFGDIDGFAGSPYRSGEVFNYSGTCLTE